MSLSDLKIGDLRKLPDEQLRGALVQLLEIQRKDRKENQLLYYQPVSPEAEKVHCSDARWIGVGGGNGASKKNGCVVLSVGVCVCSSSEPNLATKCLNCQQRDSL